MHESTEQGGTVGILCSRYYGYFILMSYARRHYVSLPTYCRFIISCSNNVVVRNYLSCTSTYVLVCFVLISVFSIKYVAFRQCWLDVSLDGGLNVAHWRAPFLLVRCSDVWRVTASHAYSLLEALKDTPTSWWKCWRTRPLFDGISFSWWMCFLHMSVFTCLTWRSDVFLELLLFCILFKFYVLLYVSFVLLNY